MRYKLRYLEMAELDLLVIDEYLSQFYPDTPGKFFKEYENAMNSLLDMPQKYVVYPDTANFRRMIVRDFLVFYKVDEALQTVTIHRILHGSQDITSKLSFNHND